MRDQLLRQVGIDHIMPLAFDSVLSTLTPQAFVRDVLIGELRLSGIVVGADFCFGHDRVGDAQTLCALAAEYGAGARIAPLLQSKNARKYSSSAIRKAIAGGDMVAASQMLGRPWSVSAQVEPGKRQGRNIGFPTANMRLGDMIAPRFGVYATRVLYKGREYNAVSNFGCRPTVGSSAPLLETHLFDFSGDLYGAEINVMFKAFIRDEKKFDTLEALKRQIADDAQRSASILKN